MPLQVRETYKNVDKGYTFGDVDWYEPFTNDVRRLFRSMQREYGRCTGKIYRDSKPPTPVGWHFEKRMLYEDARRGYDGKYKPSDYYTRGVWVEYRKVAEDDSIST